MYEGMAYGMTQLFKSIVTIGVELILALAMARISSETQFVIITTCWFLVVVLSSGSRMSFATILKGPTAERAKARACASLETHCKCMKNICVKVCTYQAPSAHNRSVVGCCRTYVSPGMFCLAIMGYWNPYSMLIQMVQWQPFEGHHLLRINFCVCHSDHRSSTRGPFDCLHNCLAFAVCRLFLKELLKSWSLFHFCMG